MRIETLDSYGALSERAATLVAAVVRRRPAAVLVLPTGTTPLGMYECLAQSGVSFAGVRAFGLDEYRGLSRSHPLSCYRYLQERFFSRVGLRPEAVDGMDGTAPDPAAECRRYEAAIAGAGGIDLAVLGLGLSGHIGLNEPGTPRDAPAHLATLAEVTLRASAETFGGYEQVPRQGMTLGIGSILQARQVLLLAAGTHKAAIVRRALTEAPGPGVPASALQGHPDCTVLLDRAAAAGLTPG